MSAGHAYLSKNIKKFMIKIKIHELMIKLWSNASL